MHSVYRNQYRILVLFSDNKEVVTAVKWVKDGVSISERDPKYSQLELQKLKVNNVQTEDGGVYQCFVTLKGGRQVQASGELRLGGKKKPRKREKFLISRMVEF